MFGLHEPSDGEDTLTAFGFVTFGSSDGFDGEKDGAPPMLSAEMIFFSSELRRCVGFTVPTFALIFTFAGFDVPPELDPPEELPPEELPPELLLVEPPQSSSKDALDSSLLHD